jgi:hypothetical protein
MQSPPGGTSSAVVAGARSPVSGSAGGAPALLLGLTAHGAAVILIEAADHVGRVRRTPRWDMSYAERYAAAAVPPVVGRDAFCRILTLALGRPGRSGAPAVLLIRPGGVDSGHLGRRLRAQVRAGDTVGWLGEAGYAVLPLGAGIAEARQIAGRLSRSLGTPVGITLVAPGEDADSLLRRLCAARRAAAVPAFSAAG